MSIPETAGACTCQTAQLAKPLGALQSPMAELLNTFAAPSPAERIIVRERILQIAEDGSQLDDEIERVEKILASLRHNRAALHKLSDGHQNVLNLTRRLPIEILGEIFIQLQCMLGGRSIAPTRVCRQWREVAIATSKLWNHINIQYTSSRALLDTEMIPIWLQRSGGQPLNIAIGSHLVPFAVTRSSNPMLDAVLHNETRRWVEVQLVVTKAMMPFLYHIPEHLPRLYSLSIDADDSHFDGFRPPGHGTGIATLNNFRHAAALRVLTLGWRITPGQIPEFPWVQLTACTLLPWGPYTCADGYFILGQAANLQFYKMALDATSGLSATLPLTNIRHINLRSLEI
ncbi:hypothetical protein FIBSPDRAFT_149038 [Athelia psychrophila]|uniref:Uncharacterized protein n=1 Tax=Athelia psychrophila TaxID=1759441 RepID=A0A166BQB0_9AGAM|nr:hypothetical protein FIBSPDRAFT_149038 [Fibularhizoctonia sp. CBS 109695]